MSQEIGTRDLAPVTQCSLPGFFAYAFDDAP